MTVHEQIRRNRRQVKAGIAVAAATALALTILRIINMEVREAGEILGSIALGVALGLPAVFAWLSLDRRPSLLPAAALGGVLSAFLSSVLFVLWLYPVWVWVRAWNERPVRARLPVGWRLLRLGLAAMVIGSFLPLFAHLDPACRQTLADGTTIEVDAAERGFGTGWTFGLGTTSTFSSSARLDPDVVSETCVSDQIVLGEAVASLAVAAGASILASRWPQGAMVGTPAEESV